MTSPYGFPQPTDIQKPPRYGVRASYTANIAALAAATTTCDTSVTLVEGDLVLLTAQNTASENGIYQVGAVASGVAPLTRWQGMNSSAGVPPGTHVYVSEGTARGNTVWMLTTDAPIVLGTTSLTFALFAGMATAPTITDFTNATHDHSATNKGGIVTAIQTVAPTVDLPAQVGNDIIPTTIQNGATYDCPTTSGASTITLPAAAADGTICYVKADGTKNGHTVQFRDATGPANLTTALTASKRFLALCIKMGGKWFVNAYVSP